jgi:putative endonuclease
LMLPGDSPPEPLRQDRTLVLCSVARLDSSLDHGGPSPRNLRVRGLWLGRRLMRTSGQERGRVAEQAAADYLRARGWQVVAANQRTPVGELDLVCLDAGTTVVVEVKARSSDYFGAAAESIGPTKQRRLRAAAAWWLSQRGGGRPVRFDAVLVRMNRAGELLSLEHLRDVMGSAA